MEFLIQHKANPSAVFTGECHNLRALSAYFNKWLIVDCVGHQQSWPFHGFLTHQYNSLNVNSIFYTLSRKNDKYTKHSLKS